MKAFKLVFVNTDGSVHSEQLIRRKRQYRKLDSGTWTKEQAIQRFKRYLLRNDSDGLGAAMVALERLNCLAEAIRSLKVNRPREQHVRCLVSFWIAKGLGTIPECFGDDLPDFVDALRRFGKPYVGEPLVLYRGELASRYDRGALGISWTSSLETARKFARRRELLNEGQSVVLKIDAKSEVIVADVKEFSDRTLTLEEHEYIVDPRLIKDLVSVVELPSRCHTF